MATKAQLTAAQENIKKAQAASHAKRTLMSLADTARRVPAKKRVLGQTPRGGVGRSLESRNSQQLYALASEHGVSGRSKMGKPELISAIRAARRPRALTSDAPLASPR
jgi:hypothetical protein